MDMVWTVTMLLPVAAGVVLGVGSAVRRLAGRPRPGPDNQASLLSRAGEVVAALLIGGAVVDGAVRGQDLLVDVQWTITFALAAALVQISLVAAGMRLMVGGALPKLLSQGNLAAGLLAAGQELATALVVGHALVGADWAALVPGLAFAIIGWLAMQLLVAAFRALTPWDDAEHIADGNAASALSGAGLVLAVGLLVSHATSGEFDGWAASLQAFAETCGFALLLVPVRVLFIQGLLLRGGLRWRHGLLDQLVGQQRNLGAAALEAAGYVGTALALRAVL